MYEILEVEGQTLVKKTNDDGSISWIPTDPSNSDYQVYLATLVTESAPTA